MKVTILAMGSQGDVQPYLALAVGLQRAGHAVVFSTAGKYQQLVQSHGIKFAALNGEFLDLAEAKGAVEGGGWKLLAKVKPMLRAMLDDAWKSSQGADLIVYHPKVLAGPDLGAALEIPSVLALPAPLYVPTAAFPNPILPPSVRLGAWGNRLSYSLTSLTNVVFGDILTDWRQATLGQHAKPSNARGAPPPILHAFSSHVVPAPKDWPPHASVTGYWFLETAEAWTPPADLEAFLANGPAPLYVGFGSMTSRDARSKTAIVLEAIRSTGQRALLSRGWGALEDQDLPEGVMMIDHVPHEWLFPKVSAVVHHGGAGTTAAGLRAGRPTVICPFFGDQPFWGQRVLDLGVGLRLPPQNQLTARGLAEAIAKVTTDQAMRERAEALGALIRSEDGVASAIEILEACGSR
jgi:sterol 3beta-glucosyltransferase